MAGGRFTNEAIVLIVIDIIRMHRLRVLACLEVHGLFEDADQGDANRRVRRKFSRLDRIPKQVGNLTRLIGVSDTTCIDNLRMDRNCFGRLCMVLREREGLIDGEYVRVEEQVAIFLGVLAHHQKNRVVKHHFWRSGQTISHYVNVVLKAVIILHEMFLANPVPVDEHCQDSRWKWFPGCLGALDGTYINVLVSSEDKPRYRNRKGQITTNTLAVCTREMRFVYILAGWEGSAGDARVLRDAVTREQGLKVPRGANTFITVFYTIDCLWVYGLTLLIWSCESGQYYLCDNGYANSEGFLTPFKAVRYYLQEWGPAAMMPQNRQEMFNMRHTKARNVIERAFAIVKMTWEILRCASYYPITMQTRLIIACFLLHNFIRDQMNVDPIEIEVDA